MMKNALALFLLVAGLSAHAQNDAISPQRLKQLVLQDARQMELEKTSEVKAAVKAAQEAIYMRFWEQSLLKSNPITTAQREAAYAELVALLGNTEYRFQHLVLTDEEDAKKTIEALKANANWDAIDFKMGMKPETNINLQKTDWVNITMLMPGFRSAAKGLSIGQVHPVPVKAQNLWHVIGLRETRPLATPPMSQIIQNVDKLVEQKIVGDKIKALAAVKEKPKK